MTTPTMGRRERKNAQTRMAIAEAALRLFLERGYDQVSVKEIADAVDVSVPTLFKHVPDGKEALMFDDGVERRAGLLTAVRERVPGQSVMAALREFMSGRGPLVANPTPEFRRIVELITNTQRCASTRANSGFAVKTIWPQPSRVKSTAPLTISPRAPLPATSWKSRSSSAPGPIWPTSTPSSTFLNTACPPNPDMHARRLDQTSVLVHRVGAAYLSPEQVCRG